MENFSALENPKDVVMGSVWLTVFSSMEILKRHLRELINNMQKSEDATACLSTLERFDGCQPENSSKTDITDGAQENDRSNSSAFSTTESTCQQSASSTSGSCSQCCSARHSDISCCTSSCEFKQMASSVSGDKNTNTPRIFFPTAQFQEMLRIEEYLQKINDLESELKTNFATLEDKESVMKNLQETVKDLSSEITELNSNNSSLLAMNAALERRLAEAEAMLMKPNDSVSRSEVSVQCRMEEPKSASKGRSASSAVKRTESLDRIPDYLQIISAKDQEIRRLRNLTAKNAELERMVFQLRIQLADQNPSNPSAINEKAVIKTHTTGSSPVSVEQPLEHHQRIISLSRTSLHSLHSIENEPEFLETTDISYWFGSQGSINSKNESASFRYKEDTPTRMQEIERRNKLQKPHLKSSYAVEMTAPSWRHSPEELKKPTDSEKQQETSDAASSVSGKPGIIKKIQTSLKMNRKKDSDRFVVKPQMPVAKPVAFTVDVTPPKSKKGKSKRAAE